MHSFLEKLASLSSPDFMVAMQGPWSWLVYFGAFFVMGCLMLGWFAAMGVVWTYGERRIAAFMQGRVGPNRVGPQGILQPIADGIKLLVKEDTIPQVAHRFLYIMAPILVMVGAFVPFVALPFSERLVVADMELGLFYVLAFEAIEVIGILMAGWAAGSKWSLYGGMRLAAQMLSYEVPMGLAVLTVIMLTGSLNMREIVEWQSNTGLWVLGWTIFRSPVTFIAFIIFYISALASAKRAPFDLPEAESELVAGFHTEYSGMRFAFFFMAEYASMYFLCALAVVLFLGGWYGPIPLPGIPEGLTVAGRFAELSAQAQSTFWGGLKLLTDGGFWSVAFNELAGAFNLVLKSFVLYFVMIWVRWTLPRIRIDQVMYICLKVLLPFSLACVIIVLFQVALF